MDCSLKEKCIFLSISYNPRGAAELETLHSAPLQLSEVRSLHRVRSAAHLPHLPLLSGFRNIMLELNTSEIKSHFWNSTSWDWTIFVEYLYSWNFFDNLSNNLAKSLVFHSLLNFVSDLCKILVKCDTLYILLCVISKSENFSTIFW